MSLILEALKKSEAERQLGRAPGLTTPMPVRGRATSAERMPLAWFALAALLVAGGGTWWLLSARPAPPPATAAAASRTESAQAQPSAAPATPAATVTRPAEPPAAPAQRGTVAAAPRQPEGEPPALREPTVPEPEMAAAAPLPRDPAFASTERESLPVEAAVPPPPPTPATAATPATATAAVPAPTAAARVAAEAAPAEDLPRLDQLGGPQREALPPLKQTMHVYAEQPAERFVLIDGHRYREGDRLAANLQLSEIRRDGTVFVLDGLRFLLPRP